MPYGWSGLLPTSGRSAPGGPPTRRGPCFLYKKAGGKNRRGCPPAPPGNKPLAGARSIFWVGGLWSGLFLAHVHQTRFGNAYSVKIFFAGYYSAKNPAKENPPKESSQIRARTWAASKPTAVLLRLYPQNRASEQRAALKTGVQGRSPWCSFLHFSQEKWRPPAGIPPGALRPEAGPRGRARRVRTNGGRAPGPTSQGPTCDGPDGTTCRYRPGPPGPLPRVDSSPKLWYNSPTTSHFPRRPGRRGA